VVAEQIYEMALTVELDSVATEMAVNALTNATQLPRSSFVVEAVSPQFGRRLATALTSVDPSQCNPSNSIYILRITFSDTNSTNVQSLLAAVRSQSTLLHSLQNGLGQPIGECGAAAVTVSRPVIPVPTLPFPVPVPRTTLWDTRFAFLCAVALVTVFLLLALGLTLSREPDVATLVANLYMSRHPAEKVVRSSKDASAVALLNLSLS
jgi:hypothetical protein